MELKYKKCGDYLIPDVKEAEEYNEPLRRYGILRRTYLQEYRKGIYTALLLKGTLDEHLLTIQEQAEARYDLLVGQMARQEGVTEELKAQDQMLWVAMMNNIRQRADEVVKAEIIYQ